MWFCFNKAAPRVRRGSAILEFAIAFSLLWVCLSAAFEFGYSVYCYNALTVAVNNGALYASTVDFDSVSQTFIQKIQNATVYGDPAGGGSRLAPGLTTSQVAVTWVSDSAGKPQTLSVAIQGYSCDTVFRVWTWNGKPASTVVFLGVYKLS